MKPKQLVVKIDLEGDDKGKMFAILKMKAEPLEDWGARLFLGLARSKVDIPEGIEEAGIAGLLRYGLSGAFSQLHIDDLRPLLAEMMDCVQCIPDPSHPDFMRPLVENDIEEVTTRLELRADWIYLHTGFSIPGVTSSLTPASGQTGQPSMPNTKTFRKQSGR